MIPIQALDDYLPSDLFHVQMYQKTTTLVRNYMQASYEVSLRLTMNDQYRDPRSFEFLGLKSDFGPSYPVQIKHSDVVVFADTPRLIGCTEYNKKTDHPIIQGKVLLLSRGTCQFEDKVWHAQQAGAKAVILMNNVEGGIFRASGSKQRNIKIPSVMLSKRDSLVLMKYAHTLQSFSMTQLLSVDPQASYKMLFLGEKVQNLILIK